MKTTRIQFPRTGLVGGGELQARFYSADPDRIALIVNGGADPSTHTVLTINPHGESLHPGEVCIKNYSGREDVPAQLVRLGVVDAEPVRYIRQGYVERVPIYRLSLSSLSRMHPYSR